ncbi:hypothetical protein BD408DRAFT_412598 [Parasitella parasitica]|nr:hypothetical protein BD408DRAFT_412598 [Parasitella parasitica]
MVHRSLIAASLLFAVIPYNVLAQVKTARCHISADLACNSFRQKQGKICASDPALCYLHDSVNNEKACVPETNELCKTFTQHKGYLCTDFFCLITVD